MELLLEGPKIIIEALQCGWKPLMLVIGSEGTPHLEQILADLPLGTLLRKASYSEMERISRLKSAPSVLGCFEVPKDLKSLQTPSIAHSKASQSLSPWWLVADRIQDPGNLGTMIRIADWFGFEGLICSPDTVDCYNSKVIQASMGSLFRIPVHYVELNPLELEKLSGMKISIAQNSKDLTFDAENQENMPWLVASLPGGMDINQIEFPEQGGMLLVGNESRGLSQNLLQYATHCVGIPSLGSAESLNAAVAAGIFANAIRSLRPKRSETP